ncbi:MAG: Blue-light-activated protein [Deltaproteobacteria bacterium ADurb.Bin510]|nr:MAG: Blue-light-activated protein [Deltaproteobacteria bacterium ADurb.Bin510]
MNKPRLTSLSLRQTILLAIVLIVLLTALSILGFVHFQTTRTILRTEDEHVRNLFATVNLNLETEYQSLLYHEDNALRQRQNELKNLDGFALTIMEGYYRASQAGSLGEAEAQRRALEELRRLRYDGGTGYFWVNDMSTPIPKVLMHPTIPEIENTYPNDPLFYQALPNGRHLLLALTEIGRDRGAGYLRYSWPKPTATGVNPGQPKLSYVVRFRGWDWIIGCGVYIDDIEAEKARRKAAIVTELRNALSRVRIGKSGYLFIFDGNKNVIIHPSLAGRNANGLLDPASGRPIFDELIRTAARPGQRLEYLWDKPGHEGDFRFRKLAYVSHFKPLDWYVGATVYMDEIEQPARNLSRKIFLLSLGCCLMAIILAQILARYLALPLIKLTSAARAIEEQGLKAASIPVSGTRETRHLGLILNRMTRSLTEASASLKENEEKLKTLIENASAAILLLREGRFVDCNQYCADMLGREKQTIIGLTPAEISPPSQPDGQNSHTKALEHIRLAMAGEPQFFEWRYEKTDGSLCESEISLNRVDLKDGPHLLAVMRDVTERKRLEEENKSSELRLRQAQKMEAIGTLAGGIAHDFNNILTGILGYGELALDEINNPQEAQSHLHEMLTAAERARNLVRQILTFSRRVESEVSAVEPHLIAKEALKLLRASIPSTIDINMDIEPAGTVMADPSQLHQIIMNLCTNAYAAMKTGGTLAVAVKACEIAPEDRVHGLTPGHYVRITVNDTGSGMDHETMQHIFEPFFTTKAKGEGTGLGLATVHGIVKSLKGEITVYSVPGEGTSFHVYLPRSDARSEQAQTKANAVPLGRGEKILLVDDELPILGLGSHLLTRLGYAATTAATPEEALAIFTREPAGFSLVITDYAMPHMNGAELAGAILKIRPDIPIVLTSGFSPDVSEKWLKDIGISHFIQKPYRLQTVAETLAAILNPA